jgi:hypothetical protein
MTIIIVIHCQKCLCISIICFWRRTSAVRRTTLWIILCLLGRMTTRMMWWNLTKISTIMRRIVITKMSHMLWAKSKTTTMKMIQNTSNISRSSRNLKGNRCLIWRSKCRSRRNLPWSLAWTLEWNRINWISVRRKRMWRRYRNQV